MNSVIPAAWTGNTRRINDLPLVVSATICTRPSWGDFCRRTSPSRSRFPATIVRFPPVVSTFSAISESDMGPR